MTPRLTLPALATLGCLAFLAPSADALTQTDYAVTIEGSASFQRTDIGPGAAGDWVHREKAEFSWKSEIPKLTFLDKQAVMGAGATTSATVKSASVDISIPTLEGPLTGGCTGSSWHTLPTPGVITGAMEQREGAGSEGLWIRVLSGGEIKLSTCWGVAGAGPAGVAVDGGAPGRLAPYMTFFEMPHEAIGMGKIIQLLDKTVSGVSCPGWYDKTDSCSLKWKAKVTFVRTFHIDYSDFGPTPEEEDDGPISPDDIPMPPKPRAEPTAPPAPVPAPTDDPDDLIPMPGASKLSRTGDSATIAVMCPPGCRGTAVATPLSGRRARGAATSKPLAKAAFVAKAGRRTVVRLRFTAAARRAIRKAGGVRVALTAIPNGGTAERATITLRRAAR